MQHHSLNFIDVPPVFKRGEHVLIAIFDAGNNLILARKRAYPSGIYRLFGGGIESNELPETAASRELEEETGQVIPTDPLHLETFTFDITESSTGNRYLFRTHLFSVNIGNQAIVPGDDVDEIKSFSKTELLALLTKYRQLPGSPESPRPHETFRWSDWGAVFSIVHQHVYDHWPE